MENNGKKQSAFMIAFDVLFVMVLCFATLLATMILQGEIVIDYKINFLTLTLVLGGTLAYMVYVIRHSNKELKEMINDLYDKE